MAQRLGCSRAAFTRLDAGESVPSVETLHRLFRMTGTESLLFILGRASADKDSELQARIDAHFGPSGTPFIGEIALILQQIRALEGIGHAELARMLGISRSLVRSYEAGVEPNSIAPLRIIMRLARETGERFLSSVAPEHGRKATHPISVRRPQTGQKSIKKGRSRNVH
jgi:transcriptional regulator with XRE-family HTH domain